MLWKNPKATGVVVGAIGVFLFVFGWLEYSIVTFACRLLQIAMIAYGIALKLDRAHLKADDVVEGFTSFLEKVKPHLVRVISFLTRVIMWEDASLSTRVLAGSIGVAMIGNMFSDLTLIFLLSVGVFAGPTLYYNHKEQIDAQLANAKKQLDHAVSSVPSAGSAKKSQ